jgi:hypothetical protein
MIHDVNEFSNSPTTSKSKRKLHIFDNLSNS